MVRAWDIDGVLADFNNAYRDIILELTGLELPPITNDYPTKWNYHEDVFITKKDLNKVWNYIKTTSFWEKLKPYPECREALIGIKEQRLNGDDIYFITSRPGRYAKRQTERWLQSQGFSDPTVLISSNKGPVCAGLGVDVFIDDKPENCEEVALACPNSDVFLLDRPYNRAFTQEYENQYNNYDERIAADIVRVQSVFAVTFEQEGMKRAA